jgi:hypothetical protein
MAEVTEREVAVEFQDVTDRELIKRCAKLCRSYNLSAVDLATKWEVMQMNSNKASQPMTFDLLAEFELTLKNAATKRQKTGDSRAAVVDARTQAIPRPHARASFNKDSAHLLHSVLGERALARPPRASKAVPPNARRPACPPLAQAILPSSAAPAPSARPSRPRSRRSASAAATPTSRLPAASAVGSTPARWWARCTPSWARPPPSPPSVSASTWATGRLAKIRT